MTPRPEPPPSSRPDPTGPERARRTSGDPARQYSERAERARRASGDPALPHPERGPSGRPDSARLADARSTGRAGGCGDEAARRDPAGARGRSRRTRAAARRSRVRLLPRRLPPRWRRALAVTGLSCAVGAGGSAGVVFLSEYQASSTALGAVATVYIAVLTTHRAIVERRIVERGKAGSPGAGEPPDGSGTASGGGRERDARH